MKNLFKINKNTPEIKSSRTVSGRIIAIICLQKFVQPRLVIITSKKA